MSWKYKKGDFVKLVFSRCDPRSNFTPGGIIFGVAARDEWEGRIVKILDLGSESGTYCTEECMIDEYCISDAMTIFNTDGLKELI